MNYAQGVLKAREAMGLSKRQLALRAGFHPSYITHIETARKRPSLDALEAIAEVLGVPVPVLVLMSAEDGDLSGISVQESEALSTALLSTLSVLKVKAGDE